jgi:hypothetical protein
MSTDIIHRPTPEFRDYLEEEVGRAYRRHHSFGRLRAVAVVVASLAVGVSAGLASAQIGETAQRDSLLQAALSDLALAGLRLDLARARHDEVAKRVSVGLVSPASLALAESELRGVEAHAMRAKLNVDEIKATSLQPRDDLNAPLVSGRDFVIERIQMDLFSAQQRLLAAEQAHAESERQVRVGAATELVLLASGLDVTRARVALGALAERRKLRKEFVDRGTPADQLMRRLRQSDLRFDAMVAQEELRVARERLGALRKLRDAGAVAELEELRARVEVKERETELQMLALQLRGMTSKP